MIMAVRSSVAYRFEFRRVLYMHQNEFAFKDLK